MEFKDLVTITGLPGIFKVVGSNKTGLVIENIADKKRISTGLRQRASYLNDISIYTQDADLPLWQVFLNLKNAIELKTELPNAKSSKTELENGMEIAAPSYDKDRVYVSDMKKVFVWFHTLAPILDFSTLGKTTDNTATVDETIVEEPITETKKTPKPATQKA